MSIQIISSIFGIVGGLGMFLYGMSIMSDGMQKAASSRISDFLDIVNRKKMMGVVLGAALTALIQSSSAATVMIVGFVNAGLLNLSQATAFIMGANVGTTITAWLVSLTQVDSAMLTFIKPDFFAPLLLGIGAFKILFGKKGSESLSGAVMTGVGFIFVGLSFMSNSMKPYVDAPIFRIMFERIGGNPVLGILAGTVVTAVIQSSAASISILQTLALSGAVPRIAGYYIVLGQNIGTCVTAMISSAGAERTGKRAAVIHLIFNVAGAVFFGILIFASSFFFKSFMFEKLTPVEVSIFHTIFNIGCALVMYPASDYLVKLSGRLVKKKQIYDDRSSILNDAEKEVLKHLDDRLLASPAIAIAEVRKEVESMAVLVMENIDEALKLNRNPDMASVDRIKEREKLINSMQSMLSDYLIKIDKHSLNEEQKLLVTSTFNTIIDIERVGDHVENIADLNIQMMNQGLKFSDSGLDDLDEIGKLVCESYEYSLEAFTHRKFSFIAECFKTEDRVDKLEKVMRQKYIRRLSDGICNSVTGAIFLDVISNLERISDHAENISDHVVAKVS